MGNRVVVLAGISVKDDGSLVLAINDHVVVDLSLETQRFMGDEKVQAMIGKHLLAQVSRLWVRENRLV